MYKKNDGFFQCFLYPDKISYLGCIFCYNFCKIVQEVCGEENMLRLRFLRKILGDWDLIRPTVGLMDVKHDKFALSQSRERGRTWNRMKNCEKPREGGDKFFVYNG